MNLEPLTLKNIIKGLFGNTLEKTWFYSRKNMSAKSADVIKRQGVNSSNTILKIKNKKGEFFIVKFLTFKFKSLYYYQLLNEAFMLKIISEKLNDDVLVPKFINLKESKNSISLTTEYVKGTTLVNLKSSSQYIVIQHVINSLRGTTPMFKKTVLKKLPKRSNTFIFLTFPVYSLLSILKNPTGIRNIFYFSFLFYRFFTPELFKKSSYMLSHRDLDPENILYKNKKAYILDPEVMALSHPLSEIATVSRYYHEVFSLNKLKKLITYYAKDQDSQNVFIALTIFYTFQMLSIEKKDSKYYKQSEHYINFLKTNLLKELSRKNKNLGERFHATLLFISGIINFVLQIFNLKFDSFIICYHSVENDSWDFSVSVDEFKRQIIFLQNNFKIVPLNEIIKNPSKNKVAITFDDGYKNIYKNALPFLKKQKISATLFVLGNPKSANRNELTNNKQLLSLSEIKQIKSQGFTIGFHTKTHGNLAEMNQHELSNEIIKGKKDFEKQTGIKLKYFAYPRGLYSTKIIDNVKKAGFRAAFTVESGSLNTSNMHLIPRYSINGSLSFEDFKTSITPVGLYLGNLYMKLLRIKDETARKLRFLKITGLRLS